MNRHLEQHSIRVAALVGAVIALGAIGSAWPESSAEPERPGHVPPVIEAHYVSAPPTIDGALDDACWADAARLEGFFIPGLSQPVPEETIGLICVDETALYVAVVCRDHTPGDIKGVEQRRNGDIWSDDWVEFELDPKHLHEDSYGFAVTPAGTQCDSIPGGSATKIEWRGDWKAAAVRTDDGWQAEMAIPFSILRYPLGQTTFGFTLERRFSEERLTACYPVMEGIAYNPSQAADLTGLHPPVNKPRPIWMPYALLGLGESSGQPFDAGLDIQYKLDNGLTALGVLNPDFSQIEGVVEPISFSYTPRYLPETRPFFATGQTSLPPSSLFYTPRIGDFDAGVKLFGTVGKETYGLLDFITLGEQNTLAAGWNHQFIPEFNAKTFVVAQDGKGQHDNLAYCLDVVRIMRNPTGHKDWWLVAMGSTAEGDPFGTSWAAGAGWGRREGQRWRGFSYYAEVVTPEFNPALGFFYDQNHYGVGANYGENTHYETGALEYRSWSIDSLYAPHLEGGGILYSRISPQYGWQWRRGRTLIMGLNQAVERDKDSSDMWAYLGWNSRDLYRTGGVYLLRGVRAGGDYSYASVGQGLRPMADLSLRLDLEYSHLASPSPEAFHGYQAVATASYDLNKERCVSMRVIGRDAGVSAYAAYRQVVRQGMDAYVILGDPDPSRTGVSRRVLAKLIWAF